MDNDKNNANLETLQHITVVRNMLNKIIVELIIRAENHDQTKFQEPELSFFSKKVNALSTMDYGSEEYEENRQSMKPALEHHYVHNRHHPEHFQVNRAIVKGQKIPIDGMNLIDIIEMLCDWKASSMRHQGGDLITSIDISRDRFIMSDDFVSILKNTEELLHV